MRARVLPLLALLGPVLARSARADDAAPLPDLPPPSPQSVEVAPMPAPAPRASSAPAPRPAVPMPPKHCVGWAIVGGLVGASVGWYSLDAAVGYMRGSTRSDTLGAMSAIAGAELGGALVGVYAACKVSGDPRPVPAAVFVTAGGFLGLAAGAAGGYGIARAAIRGEGDNPVGSALTILGTAVVGATLGGWAGWKVHQAFLPDVAVSTDGANLGLRGRF